MTIEEIRNEAMVKLNVVDSKTDKLLELIELIATGHTGIGELDDTYRDIKQTVKELNKLAKAFRKLKPETK